MGRPSRRLTASRLHRASARQDAHLPVARGHQGGGLGYRNPTPTHLYEKAALLGPPTGGGPSAPAMSYSTPSHRRGCMSARLGAVIALCCLYHNQLNHAVHCRTWRKHGESGIGAPCTCLLATSSTPLCGALAWEDCTVVCLVPLLSLPFTFGQGQLRLAWLVLRY